MVCGRCFGVVCFGDLGVSLGDLFFPEWGGVFGTFVGVGYGVSLFSGVGGVFLWVLGGLVGVCFFDIQRAHRTYNA